VNFILGFAVGEQIPRATNAALGTSSAPRSKENVRNIDGIWCKGSERYRRWILNTQGGSCIFCSVGLEDSMKLKIVHKLNTATIAMEQMFYLSFNKQVLLHGAKIRVSHQKAAWKK